MTQFQPQALFMSPLAEFSPPNVFWQRRSFRPFRAHIGRIQKMLVVDMSWREFFKLTAQRTFLAHQNLEFPVPIGGKMLH